jgi:hypothetical protein
MYSRTKILLGLPLALILAGMVLTLNPRPANAHPNEHPPGIPLDFLTGGGWIERITGVKANFGVGGGVKNGAYWGHLNYIDHGTGLHVKGVSVTAYLFIDERTRDICGRAETNLFGEVAYHVRATDNGEPGRDDIFIIRLGQGGAIVYTTEGDPDRTLGGPGPGGGNIQLHKGNRSNTAPATPPVCEI